MNYKELIHNLAFDEATEERILSFEYFFLTKNIGNLYDLKNILSDYTFIKTDDLEQIYNLYLKVWISFDLENAFLDILNSTLYDKYLDISRLKNLWEHIEKYNIILDEVYNKIQKIELKMEEESDNDLASIENELKNLL